MKIFNEKKKAIHNGIDSRIEELVANGITPDEQKELETLLKVRDSYRTGVDTDTLFKGGISLATVLLILKYEEVGVVTSKTFGLFQKMLP